MEPIAINRRRLIVPEPVQLWTASLPEKRRMIIGAKSNWACFRASFGFKIPDNVNTLVFGTTPKMNQKYDKSEELIFGLSLAQSNLSGINVCPWSTPECRGNCVGKNGNNGFPAVMRAKIAKTRFIFEHPEDAAIVLADFWEKANDKAVEGYEVGGRLNTYSDINWIEAAPWLFTRFDSINYYDYTKDWNRESPFENYHLTYSASERTEEHVIKHYLNRGLNVAMIFSSWSKLPTEYFGFQVINGDEDDVRWKDPAGVIVGLKRKGSMKANSPMVWDF